MRPRLAASIVRRARVEGAPARRVLALGEMTDWRAGVELAPQDDGSFACALELAAGVYAFKLRADDEWELPEGYALRGAGGIDNAIVRVGAAPEPWLHAPAPPWLEPLALGGARFLVGVRRGATGGCPSIEIARGDRGERLETRFVHEEDHHVFFEATTRDASTAFQYELLLGDERSGPLSFTPTPARERTAEWWRRASVYTILVDRFRPRVDRDEWADLAPTTADAGGHLDGITRSLDYLEGLGVDTLYLTPVHVAESSHRYDLVDPLRVDPSLGGEESYGALVAGLHARGMKLVQDLCFSHAGPSFPPAADVLARGRSSPYAPWFLWSEGPSPTLRHYGKRRRAPLLDLTHQDVEALVLEAVDGWARRGVDGLRLDMTAEVPRELGRRIRERLRAHTPHAVVLGEVVPEHAWRYRNDGIVDSATDFGFHALLTDVVLGRASAEELARRLARLRVVRGGDPIVHDVRFTSTHDHPRLATVARAHGVEERVGLAHVLWATLPGVPMLLYGEEHALSSAMSDAELEDVWADRAPMPWDGAPRAPERMTLLTALLRARRAHRALSEGDLSILHAEGGTLIFRRSAGGECVDVVVHLDGEPIVASLEDGDFPSVEVLATTGGASASGHDVSLPAWSAAVLRRAPTATSAIHPVRAGRNAAVVDAAMQDSAFDAAILPTRFELAVTERCNLRCLHCITHAPERTANGTARTMSRATLDALAPSLGYADYFAFVHGGESLTAPIFWDVLAAIEAARGDEPYVAHLLTNGLLLDEATAARLVDRGVSSVSVSLDGATAATNDRIREGGRFERVVRQLRSVVEERRRARWDLRLGLSFVLLRDNVEEAVDFIDLAADIGVDWVKLEEPVGATPYARRALLTWEDATMRAAVGRASARARERSLVFVEHASGRAVWRCRLEDDAEMRELLRSDEHANRTTIHPCRAPWDTASIEPNGDVRVSDFFGAILGNVAEAPLSELWRGPLAVEARRAHAARRLCGPTGPVVCVPTRSPR